MRWCILLIVCCWISTVKAQLYSDSISVNFFLLVDCRISQNISGEIRYVLDQYDDPVFSYQCYFPGTFSNRSEAQQFLTEYQLDLPFRIDYYKSRTHHYQASIAPQVVVYDEVNEIILYSGRIDNSYDKVGSRRRVVTSRDLRNALEAIRKQVPIEEKELPAVGCIIGDTP